MPHRPARRTRRGAASALLLLVALVLVTGCGTEEPSAEPPADAPASSPGPDETTERTERSEPAEPAEPAGTVVDVTIEGDRISPSGERVEVAAGETVTFRVVSDRAGELHVHSAPEQVLDYAAGETVLELTIDRPGVVEVEDHDGGQVVVQLQVS